MKKFNLLTLLIACFALNYTPTTTGADAPETPETPNALMPKKHFELFDAYCLNCHDADTEKGDLNLEDLSFDLGTIESAELWQKVLDAMNSGEMPPEKKKQPSASEKTSFLEDLSGQLVTAREILGDSGGVITMRRLNRREYANTLRDLLGVEVDITELPNDASPGGYDTTGSSLFFSSDQFEKYLALGRLAMDEAIVTRPKPKVQRTRIEAEVEATRSFQNKYNSLYKTHERYVAWQNSGKAPTEFGFTDAARAGLEHNGYLKQAPTYKRYLENPLADSGALLIYSNSGGYIAKTAPPAKGGPGRYLLRAKIGILEGAPNKAPFIELGQPTEGTVAGELSLIDCRRVTGLRGDPQIMEFAVTVTGNGPRNFGIRERSSNDSKAGKRIYQAAEKETGVGPDPSLWIDWFEWEGPLVAQWPPAGHEQIFFKGEGAEQNDAYARQIIVRFARRAFRVRGASDSFVDKLMGFYRDQREAGLSFREAIKEPLAILLASPGFLYLSEPTSPHKNTTTDKSIAEETAPVTPTALTQEELAVRLAYFLWSAPPDEKLLSLGRAGKLANPKILKQQTDRLLADDRAWQFIEGFTHQWLTMERLDFFQYNSTLFPEFDDSVKQAARDEVYHNIEWLLREDIPLGELLDSDFVVINELLADYYDIPDVKGHAFRIVEVPEGLPRGGLLGMAAILAMGSDGERSSPVERGSWILRKLLNDPPPPAPANVPMLSRFATQLLPARELQQTHMEEPQCAQCHRKIDPMGFGLENFNAAGQWREKEITAITKANGKVEKTKEHPIDPHGAMPDGVPFDDFFGLRAGVAEHEADFARGFTEALIEYSLGRPYGFSDYDLAQRILKHANTQNNTLPSFIHSLVQSKTFQRK